MSDIHSLLPAADVDAPPLVAVDEVSKSFGAKTALHNVSFSVPSGQICGLLGPNGAGKTTLFRLLMGILKASSGRLLIDSLTLLKTASPPSASSASCPMSLSSIPISPAARFSSSAPPCMASMCGKP